MSIEAGQAAPAFTLNDQDGKKVSLRDLRGRNVIVYFYPKDDTPGCTLEAQGFRALWKQFEELDAVVLGVSPDGADSHCDFIAKYELPFPLLSDPDRKMMTTYDAYGEKVLYGKKSIGVIRSTVWVGPDGIVKKHWKKVPKAEDHPGQVLKAISAAG